MGRAWWWRPIAYISACTLCIGSVVAVLMLGPPRPSTELQPGDTVAIDLRRKPVPAWTTDLGKVTLVGASRDVSMFSSPEALIAVDTATGRERWRQRIPEQVGQCWLTSVAVCDTPAGRTSYRVYHDLQTGAAIPRPADPPSVAPQRTAKPVPIHPGWSRTRKPTHSEPDMCTIVPVSRPGTVGATDPDSGRLVWMASVDIDTTPPPGARCVGRTVFFQASTTATLVQSMLPGFDIETGHPVPRLPITDLDDIVAQHGDVAVLKVPPTPADRTRPPNELRPPPSVDPTRTPANVVNVYFTEYRAVDTLTGKTLWRPDPGTGLVRVGDQLFAAVDDGYALLRAPY